MVLVSSPGVPVDQTIANWSQFAAAAGVLLGALIAVVTILTGRRTARRETVFRFLERQDTDRYTALFSWADGFVVLDDDTAPEAGFARFESLSTDDQDRIWRVFNFWEEIGLSYREGLLDDRLFKEALAPILIQAWQEAEWLVDRLRVDLNGHRDPTLWGAWEMVYRKLEPVVPYTHAAGHPAVATDRPEWRELFPPD